MQIFTIPFSALLGHIGHKIEIINPDGGNTVEVRCKEVECETEEPLFEAVNLK